MKIREGLGWGYGWVCKVSKASLRVLMGDVGFVSR